MRDALEPFLRSSSATAAAHAIPAYDSVPSPPPRGAAPRQLGGGAMHWSWSLHRQLQPPPSLAEVEFPNLFSEWLIVILLIFHWFSDRLSIVWFRSMELLSCNLIWCSRWGWRRRQSVLLRPPQASAPTDDCSAAKALWVPTISSVFIVGGEPYYSLYSTSKRKRWLRPWFFYDSCGDFPTLQGAPSIIYTPFDS
jgi:hypothetical protein